MGWIKTSDELPERYKEVLALTKHNVYVVAYYDGDRFVVPDFIDSENWTKISVGYVSYWRPLPERPNEIFAR